MIKGHIIQNPLNKVESYIENGIDALANYLKTTKLFGELNEKAANELNQKTYCNRRERIKMKYPKAKINLFGIDGNAYSIMGAAAKALKKQASRKTR